jgi:hypothetical protein
MAERTPVVKKYRDVLENVITSAMDFVARTTDPGYGAQQRDLSEDFPSQSNQQRQDSGTTSGIFSKDDHQIVQGLLGLSAQQPPDQVPASLASSVPSQTNPPPESVNLTSRQQQTTFENLQNQTMPSGFRNEIYTNGRPEIRGWNLSSEFSDSQYFGDEWGQNVWEGDRYSFQMLNEMMSLDGGP